MLDLGGGTGTPEAEHPRRDLQRIGRRHAERTERIEKPLRRFPENAGRRERQYIGEGEGAGIACRRARRRPFAIDDGDRKAARLRGDRRREADNAGPDNDGIIGWHYRTLARNFCVSACCGAPNSWSGVPISAITP